jgi:hypothetical protein
MGTGGGGTIARVLLSVLPQAIELLPATSYLCKKMMKSTHFKLVRAVGVKSACRGRFVLGLPNPCTP